MIRIYYRQLGWLLIGLTIAVIALTVATVMLFTAMSNKANARPICPQGKIYRPTQGVCQDKRAAINQGVYRGSRKAYRQRATRPAQRANRSAYAPRPSIRYRVAPAQQTPPAPVRSIQTHDPRRPDYVSPHRDGFPAGWPPPPGPRSDHNGTETNPFGSLSPMVSAADLEHWLTNQD